MPNWTYEWINITSTQDAEFRVECERQDHIYELQVQMHEQQQIEEERQLIEDKRKYPLFFLKDGIV